MNITKRLARDNSYVRPKTTYQETMTNKEINDKLKDYKKVINILQVPLNTHVRYFTTDKTGKKAFRLGGSISKYGDNMKYVVLTNGTLSWSVQIANSQFYQKMTESEVKNEIRKEIMTECEGSINKDIENENKELKKENKNLLKKLEHLTDKISYIEETIKKERQKTDKMDGKKNKK